MLPAKRLPSALVAASLLCSTAYAGDPCPIRFAVTNLGVPEWAKPELREMVKGGDRFFDRMVAAAAKQECSELQTVEPKNGSLDLKLYDTPKPEKHLAVPAIVSKLFNSQRGFQCGAASRSLKTLRRLAEYDGLVVFFRGHRRVLIVVPGWKSMCVSSTEADKMSEEQVLGVWNKVTGSLVKDRHNNP